MTLRTFYAAVDPSQDVIAENPIALRWTVSAGALVPATAKVGSLDFISNGQTVGGFTVSAAPSGTDLFATVTASYGEVSTALLNNTSTFVTAQCTHTPTGRVLVITFYVDTFVGGTGK